LGASNSWKLLGLFRPVMGLLYLSQKLAIIFFKKPLNRPIFVTKILLVFCELGTLF